MGIHNIEILVHPDVKVDDLSYLRQRQEELAARMIRDHRRGEHTPGNMRRDCPLCQDNR